ncbi:MAG: Ig-like domain-containing protein [Candidatus Rokubacteria bacterium]|nr:Ig-like domain-containing protein [Candidatus Rokubacteria bacterium]
MTLLPDGRWLLIGGQGSQGPLATVTIQDPGIGSTTALPPLRQPRAGHSATVLPEGGVLVLGGLGPDGQVVTAVEHYDATGQSSHSMSSAGLTPRAYHSATLLTDGRVLVAGGVSREGQVLGDAQLFDPLTYAVESVPALLTTPRSGATASLLSDGRVLIWGGVDAGGAALTTGELFDPAQPGFAGLTVPPATPDPSDSPTLEASNPTVGSVDVPTNSLLALRFSKPLRVDPTTAGTVTLTGALGPEPVTVVAAEAGRLVFVNPRAGLTPGTTYTVAVNGAVDVTGLLVPFTSVVFQTAAPPAGGGDGVRVPMVQTAMGHFHPVNAVTPGAPGETDEWEWHGPLCDGRPCSPWQTLLIPGLEIRIPGNVILQTSSGPIRSIPLTRIPVDRPPFPLPRGATFAFTPQTYGALVQQPDGTPNPAGVRIILPNVDGLPAGTRVGLQSYEPAKGWFVYGEGMVSADGTQIIPDAGVEFHRVTCFFSLGPPSNFAFAAVKPGGTRAGEPVDLATGIFTMEKVDLVLPDVIPIVIRREYRQNDAVARGGEYGVGNLTTITDPLNQTTTLTYTASGQPLTITTPAGTTRLGYDRGDVATITDAVGNTTTRFTDDGGRLTSLTTALGQRTRFEYDALNQLRKVTDPLGGQTQLTCDPNGNLLGLTDARGGTTSYAYNSMDRVTTRTDPLLRPESYGYDGNGNPTALTDRKGQQANRLYDALDRLTQVSYQDGSTTSFTWDAGNRLTQIVDSLAGTIIRGYDMLDRLIQEVTAQGTVSYT